MARVGRWHGRAQSAGRVDQPRLAGRSQSKGLGRGRAPAYAWAREGEAGGWRRCPAQLLARVLTVVLAGLVGSSNLGCGTAEKQGADRSAEQAQADPKTPRPSEPKPIVLSELEPVVVEVGSTASVRFSVQRNGNEGPIQVRVEGVPEGLVAETADIPEGQSEGKLELAATEKLGDEELNDTLQVTVQLGEQADTKALGVTVPKLKLPRFVPAAPAVLKPGMDATVRVEIQRNGFQGPLSVRLVSLPEKVRGQAKPVGTGEDVAEVTFSVAPDAAEGEYEARVESVILGRTISVPVKLKVHRFPFRVECLLAVHLKPGERKTIQVPVKRRSYSGPIDIQVSNLPEGVTAESVEVPAGETRAGIRLVAAPDAREEVRSAIVTAKGGRIRQQEAMVVRVTSGRRGYLPPEIVWDPDKAVLLRRGSFGGRLDAKSKAALVRSYGGTKESEAAVLRGLRWLAAHQQPDGGWSLNRYADGIEGCDCATEFEAKVDDSDTAATAFALLPMLGAGVTHLGTPGEPSELVRYRRVVAKGLAYLRQRQVRNPRDENVGYLGGNMYAHALATMVFCEAYGLTQDRALKIPTQLAVKYLMESQHREGGWRYSREQPGDLSVTSWVFFAIRSAQLAGLPIKRNALVRAERFLGACAVAAGPTRQARYAYMPGRDASLSMTAAGLLTRQFIGWPKDHPDLVAGCQYLMENLPPESAESLGRIYYYHYATQVLHNMEGPEFDLWNYRMREHLIRTQEQYGHRAGSWDPEGTDWGSRGGRLYATSLALLTLEIYYRHLPMYRPVLRTPTQAKAAP